MSRRPLGKTTGRHDVQLEARISNRAWEALLGSRRPRETFITVPPTSLYPGHVVARGSFREEALLDGFEFVGEVLADCATPEAAEAAVRLLSVEGP